jgi:hypothetical protein
VREGDGNVGATVLLATAQMKTTIAAPIRGKTRRPTRFSSFSRVKLFMDAYSLSESSCKLQSTVFLARLEGMSAQPFML